MKLLVLLSMFLISTHTLFAETTRSGGRNNPRWRPNRNRVASACHGIEEDFRKHLLNVVAATTAATILNTDCTGTGPESRTQACKETRAPYLEGLEKYRRLLRRFNGSLAQQWSQQDPSGLRASCLRSVGNGADRRVALSDNARVLAVPESKRAQCQPVITQWGLTQDQFAQDYLKQKESLPGLSTDDIKFVDSFQSSPLAGHLSARGKYDLRAKTIHLKQDLNTAFTKTLKQLDSLKNRLEDSGGPSSYKLYTFNNQFQDYAKSLTPPNDETALNCAKDQGFKQDCFQTSRASSGGRCAKRLLGLGKEFFPVFGLIDAFQGLSSAGGAEAAGILTTEEATAEKAGHVFQAFAGIDAVRRSTAASQATNGTQAQLERAASGRRQSQDRDRRTGRSRGAGNRRRAASERIVNLGAKDRGDRARDFLGLRYLSNKKRNGVKEAHEIGADELGRDGTPARFGNYTDDQLKRKLRRLREAGFTKQESSNLVRAGIAGKPNRTLVDVFKSGKVVGDDQFVSIPTNKGLKYGRIIEYRADGSAVVQYEKTKGSGIFKEIEVDKDLADQVHVDIGGKGLAYPGSSRLSANQTRAGPEGPSGLSDAEKEAIDQRVRSFARDIWPGDTPPTTRARSQQTDSANAFAGPGGTDPYKNSEFTIRSKSGNEYYGTLLGEKDFEGSRVLVVRQPSGEEVLLDKSRLNFQTFAVARPERSQSRQSIPTGSSPSRRSGAKSSSEVRSLFRDLPVHQQDVNVLAQKPLPVQVDGKVSKRQIVQSGEIRSKEIYSHQGPVAKPLPDGYYTYTVLDDQSISIGRVHDQLENGVKHVNVANGRKVNVAGELRIVNGEIDFNIESGSFSRHIAGAIPNGDEVLEQRAQDALTYFLGRKPRTQRGTFFSDLPPVDLRHYCTKDKSFRSLNAVTCCDAIQVCN